MPTLPLYSTPAHPDAWHQVRAPGGYEWWHFQAYDVPNDRHLIATFLQGDPLHAQYQRRYWRYRRFPTRFKPPLPQGYPCVHFSLYEGRHARAQIIERCPPEQFTASTDRPEVVVGPNRKTWEDGRFQLHLQFSSQLLRSSLSFVPRHQVEPLEIKFAQQRLIIASPLCDVEGTVHFGSEELTFAGRGFPEHQYGTEPFGAGVKRMLVGRALLDAAAYTFYVSQEMDDPALSAWLVETTRNSTQAIPIARATADWSARSRYFLDYPQAVALDDVIQLQNPRVIDASLSQVRLIYDARCRSGRTTALCEVIYPPRLRWPLIHLPSRSSRWRASFGRSPAG